MARRKNKKRVRAKDQVAFSEAWSADAQQGSTRESTQPSPTTTAVPPHHRNSRPRVEDTTHLDAYLEYMQISHPTGPLVTSNTCKAIENRHLRHDDIRQLIRAVDNQLTGAVTDQHAPWSPSQITIPPTYATAESTSALVTHAVDWAGIVDPSVYGTIGVCLDKGSFFSDGRGDMPLITIHPPSTGYTPPADCAATTSAIGPSSLGPTIPVLCPVQTPSKEATSGSQAAGHGWRCLIDHCLFVCFAPILQMDWGWRFLNPHIRLRPL
ncbi:hypothetical protein BN1723_016061 [Verticillium longisporum]|uniref:Uncharacterized protein n=1 Tax=Verticillium longisporum TaxID=100787 RepID=A0A0G4N8A7_VERLO|nr:hypothetical protein BN1723_016061 [Verticillium longisporum]